VSVEYIHEMKALGYHPATVEGLCAHDTACRPTRKSNPKARLFESVARRSRRIHDHGVSVAFIQELERLGFRRADRGYNCASTTTA
jgi:hypothetical protein